MNERITDERLVELFAHASRTSEESLNPRLWQEMTAALRELQELRSGREWRTMDSAPRDGTSVLLLTTCHGQVEAWFKKSEQHGQEYDGAMWVCADDAFQIEVEETSDGYLDGTATHWRPLPEPPHAEESAR